MTITPFLVEGLAVVPRVLGLCDRDSGSATYGCCDRSHWHYRSTDFANTRYQEAGLLFALAYALAVPGNRFHGKAAMAAWARAAWRFWLKRRNRDGSMAEAWPGDRGFCGTAFTAASFVETVALLGGPSTWEEEMRQAGPTFAWLARHSNPEVANQQAGSLWALAGWAALTGSAQAAAWTVCRRDEMLRLQDGTGWFPEYGGGDTGYQSISMAALARAGRWLGGDDAIAGALDRAEKALAPLVGEDGLADPTANSRGTQYIYPSALLGLGSPVATRLAHGLIAGTCLRPSWMDDRYCIAFAADYLLGGDPSHSYGMAPSC